MALTILVALARAMESQCCATFVSLDHMFKITYEEEHIHRSQREREREISYDNDFAES